MPIQVMLPPVPVIREAAAGNDKILATGSTVGEILQNVIAQYPALEAKLFDGGTLRPHIILTLNDEDTRYLDEMDTAVTDTDVIAIVPAVAGGSR
jgi:molybdopterin converting factor small subunit